jgi:hypothetical protein
MKDEYKGWVVAGIFFIALLIAQITNYVDNKHKQIHSQSAHCTDTTMKSLRQTSVSLCYETANYTGCMS